LDPSSIDRIKAAFKSGRRDSEEYITRKTDGRVIKVVYYAVRNNDGSYLGMLKTAWIISPEVSVTDAG
jgi:DUF438 domain-containing protein